MNVLTNESTNGSLTDEVIDLLLDEADRALLDVEARTDDPGRRLSLSDRETQEMEDLRLAMAELSDAYPGMQYELESIGDRLRNVGAIAATTELEQHPHIIHMVRLSLEVLFRLHPTVRDYESHTDDEDEEADDDAQTPFEVYHTYQQLLEMLRSRVN
jgi:hypothetical protein